MKADDGMTATPVQAIVGAPLSFGSLFAGIGGFDLGFERAGIVCKWQVEIDDYANRVLAKHWPHVHRERDVREVGRHNLESVDVICGGFPCQDISYAGKGAGITGDRSGLWFEYARVIRDMEPRFVVVENVTALLTRGLDSVLGTLASLGYDAEWECIPAAAIGAPHARDRIWIIAHTAGERLEGWRSPISTRTKQRDIAGRTFRSGASWPDAPRLPGMGYGLSDWVDRVSCCGNAVVPQVAELIGRRIVEAAGRTPATCSDAARQDAGDWSH